MVAKSQATQPLSKPIAKDIANREGKRKKPDGAPQGRQAPAKKTRKADDPPPRKKRAAAAASQVLCCSACVSWLNLLTSSPTDTTADCCFLHNCHLPESASPIASC